MLRVTYRMPAWPTDRTAMWTAPSRAWLEHLIRTTPTIIIVLVES